MNILYNEKVYNNILSSLKDTIPRKFIPISECLLYPNNTGEHGSIMICKFLKTNPNIFVVGDELGFLHIYDVSSTPKFLKKTQLHKNSIFDIAFKPFNNKFYISASGDKSIKLWDLETNSNIHTYLGHTGSIKSLDFCWCDENIFSSGARDGSIRIWDLRCCNKAIDVIKNAHLNDEAYSYLKKRRSINRSCSESNYQPDSHAKYHSVTCVTFQNQCKLISCGATDGKVKVWELRKTHHVQKHSIPYSVFSGISTKIENESISKRSRTPTSMAFTLDPGVTNHGYTHVVLDSSRTKVYANSYNGHAVHAFDTQCYGRDTMDRAGGCRRGDLALYRGPVRTYSKLQANMYSNLRPRGSGSSPDHDNYFCSSFYDRIDISPNDAYLICGSTNGRGYLWEILDDDSNARVGYEFYKILHSDISCVAWSPTDLGTFATSDSDSFRMWGLDMGTTVNDGSVGDSRPPPYKTVKAPLKKLYSVPDSPGPDGKSSPGPYTLYLPVRDGNSFRYVKTSVATPTQHLPNYAEVPYGSKVRYRRTIRCFSNTGPSATNPLADDGRTAPRPTKRPAPGLDGWLVGKSIVTKPGPRLEGESMRCESPTLPNGCLSPSDGAPCGASYRKKMNFGRESGENEDSVLKDISNNVPSTAPELRSSDAKALKSLAKAGDPNGRLSSPCKRISDYFLPLSHSR